LAGLRGSIIVARGIALERILPLIDFQEDAMSFAIYGVGYLILIVGVAYMAHLLHIPQAWIIGIVIMLLGAGIVSAVQNTRQRDPR
jgi:pilus assembly protein TadC